MLAKVTGAPIFGLDVTLPDMLYGTVKLSPRVLGEAASGRYSPKPKECRA